MNELRIGDRDRSVGQGVREQRAADIWVRVGGVFGGGVGVGVFQDAELFVEEGVVCFLPFFPSPLRILTDVEHRLWPKDEED